MAFNGNILVNPSFVNVPTAFDYFLAFAAAHIYSIRAFLWILREQSPILISYYHVSQMKAEIKAELLCCHRGESPCNTPKEIRRNEFRV